MLVRSSTAIGLFGSAAQAASIDRARFSVVSAASSEVSPAMGISQCTASRNSDCLVPKYWMTEDLSTPAAAAIPRMVARSYPHAESRALASGAPSASTKASGSFSNETR